MSYQLIESDAQLRDLLARVLPAQAVAVDTEFMRRNTFYPHPGLYQLCFSSEPQTAWLVDPLRVTDFTPLRELFSDLQCVKVLHSASEDLEVFQHFLGVQPQPYFDTQKAAAFTGHGFGLGYGALVLSIIGQEICKDETRSDWLDRPLTDAQLNYAAADVIPLLQVYAQLNEELIANGKLDWVLEEGRSAVEIASSDGPAPHLRIKSAWKLAPRELALLARICQWREERAVRSDKPRGWILKDPVCLELARQSPTNIQALRLVKDLPSAVVRKQGEQLLDLVDEVEGLAEEEWPRPMPRPLDAAQRDQLKALKKMAAGIAEELGIAPEALMPSKDYELLLRHSNGESIDLPSRWSGWRQQNVIQPLLLATGKA